MNTKGYAVHKPTDLLAPWNFERRSPGPKDVSIDILYCGVCHSDIHQARGEWGNSMYPMVPGHEIVGRVTAVGSEVQSFKPGMLAGIGCMVDSCHTCASCQQGLEQFCEKGRTVYTYNSYELDGKTLTFGGYSKHIVCREDFVLHIDDRLPLAGVAPLLCAGITTYSPVRRFNMGAGHRLAVLGLGGLGHMAVKFGAAVGAEVTVLSTSERKEADALRLGAKHFVNTKDKSQVSAVRNSFDFIIDTVSAPHAYDFYLRMLKVGGTMICVGIPTDPIKVNSFALLDGNKTITASSIGGIAETQEMLDFCAAHQIVSDVEVIAIDQVNAAYERVIKSDVKYRFVIDMGTL